MNERRLESKLGFGFAAREVSRVSVATHDGEFRRAARSKSRPNSTSSEPRAASLPISGALWSLTLIALIVSGAANPSWGDESRPHSATELVYGVDSAEYFASISVLTSPANQWLPDKSPFPVIIAAFSGKAKSHLMERHNRLRTIELNKLEYKTVGSPYFKGYPSELPSAPVWYLVLEFRCISVDGVRLDRSDSTVVMMLDGTILRMVKKGKQ